MTRKSVPFILALVFLCCLPNRAQDARGAGNKPKAELQNRTALVIGNGSYADASLKNPVNDATDMAAALQELGFEVTLRTNLNQKELKSAIRAFGEQLRGGGIGLFYYAGHGVQVKGINYLVPVGMTANSEQEVEYEAVEAGFVLAQMEAANNSMNFVIMDACRNNPFARSYRSGDKGLAQMSAPKGSLIAYSTAPGSVASDGIGRNGIYTAELLKKIRTPDLDIKDVFQKVRVSVLNLTQNKQTPWESNSLTDNFYFIGKVGSPVTVSETLSNSASSTAAVELSFWDSIKYSTDAEDFKEYLERFPNGQFSGIARRKIQSLKIKPSFDSDKINLPPKTDAPRTWTVENGLFTFELLQCRLSGTTVFCDFSITNNAEEERNLAFVYRHSLFDEAGNETYASRVEVANKGYQATLTKKGKTRAQVTFAKVSAEATVASLLVFKLKSRDVGNFEIKFRDIPLRETTRSLSNVVPEADDTNPVLEKNSLPLTNRDNNTNTFEVRAGGRWVDSGLTVSPGMKVEVTVSGGIQVKVDNSAYGTILGSVLKKPIKVPPSVKMVGGQALVTKIKYQKGGESKTLTVGDRNLLTVENGEYGKLYFAIDRKYAAGNGSLSVTLKW